MPLLDSLVENPKKFGKLFPLHPRNPPLEPGTWSKRKEVDGDSFYQVKGEKRILWLKLIKSYYGEGGYSFDFSETPEDGYEPVYWLPWGANQVYRTALRPSKKFSDPGKSFDYLTGLVLRSAFSGDSRDPAELERDLKIAFALGGVDPRLFFTATINGCSVFVEGTEEEPIVYHANAADHLMGFHQIDSGLAFAVLQKEKIEHMVKQYRKFSGGHPKGPRSSLLPPSPTTVTLPTDYLVVGQDKHYMEWFKEDVRRLVEQYVSEEGSFKISMESIKDVKLEEGAGTVFGVRSGGRWKFYYQKLVFVTCFRNEGVFKPDWKKKSHWYVAECEQFWPEGGGSYRFRI